jgi:hypothetical protein
MATIPVHYSHLFPTNVLLISDAMATSSSLTTIPLHEPVFQQFLHDVHHAYLLLHRAMSLYSYADSEHRTNLIA